MINMKYSCRICLTENTGELFSLFDDCLDNLCEKVMYCTNLKLQPIEGLPNEICKSCYNDLSNANDFRLRCKDSDIFLRKTFPQLFLNEYTEKTSEPVDEILDKNIELKVKSDNPPVGLIKLNTDSLIIIDRKPEVYIDVQSKISGVEIKEESDDYLDSSDVLGAELSNCDDYRPPNKRTKKKNLKKFKDLLEPSENNENTIIKEELASEPGNFEETNFLDHVNVGDIEKNKTKMYICGECGKPLTKYSSLKRHIENMHSQNKKTLTSSRKTGHGKEKRFHCPLCPYVTKFSQSLVYHERIHTGERPHKCPHCSRSFSQPGSLSCHLKTHSDKTYFTCASCGKQFKHKDSYEVHKLIHSENRELFTCEICNTSLKSRKTLESHMNRHNNIKNFSCETCGLRFVTLVELINHSKKHNTEKIYKCNFCDFQTALKRSLQSHTKRHSNYRPFKCPNCDLSCFTKWELRNHEKTHTRECNYTCLVCHRKFIHSSSVNKHMQRTHGIKYQRTEDVDRRKVK